MAKLTNVVNTDGFKAFSTALEKTEWNIDPVSINPEEIDGRYNYSLIGTAFDYLLRFKIEHENPDAKIYKSDELVAEKTVRLLKRPDIGLRPLNNTERDFFDTAISKYETYVSGDGELPVESCLLFAKLDPIYRGAQIPLDSIDLSSTESYYKNDLKNLLSGSEKVWDVEEYAVLNPSMGLGPSLGADADLIVDDTLIDIKTTVNPTFTGEQFRQLLGYLALLDIHSDSTINEWDVEKPAKAGIYYSRSSDLKTFDADIVYSEPILSEMKDHLFYHATKV